MTVEVCLTPELIHQHDLNGKIAVVVDIFRATSCMISGMAHQVKAIYPVETVDECTKLGKEGMVTAGERGGVKVEHFDIGNSPFDYMDPQWSGRDIAVSTTNGTLAIKKSEKATEVLIGAFLNIKATANKLREMANDVLIHCAGWKGTPNLEDTLYAGALINELSSTHEMTGDSAFLAYALFAHHQDDLLSAAKKSGHAHRLAGFGISKDIEFCMQSNVFDVVVAYREQKLVRI